MLSLKLTTSGVLTGSAIWLNKLSKLLACWVTISHCRSERTLIKLLSRSTNTLAGRNEFPAQIHSLFISGSSEKAEFDGVGKPNLNRVGLTISG